MTTIVQRKGVSIVMAESDEDEKHSSKAVTDEPQEELIELQAQPSHSEPQDQQSPDGGE